MKTSKRHKEYVLTKLVVPVKIMDGVHVYVCVCVPGILRTCVYTYTYVYMHLYTYFIHYTVNKTFRSVFLYKINSMNEN
jgi:uncharacterized membrane protein